MGQREITIKVLKAVLAIDSKNFAESLGVLKELGYDHSNRFEYGATEFVSDLVKEHIKDLERMEKKMFGGVCKFKGCRYNDACICKNQLATLEECKDHYKGQINN